jgi:hypothetical protein
MFEGVCERNLEGIVCKRKRSIYAEHGWIKIKNPLFTAFREPRRKQNEEATLIPKLSSCVFNDAEGESYQRNHGWQQSNKFQVRLFREA